MQSRSQALPLLSLEGHALFLDIDGTLAPLAATPSEAKIPSNLLRDLNVLRRKTQGAIALISGRPLVGIDRLCNIFPPFPAAGQHGLEIRGADGITHAPYPDPQLMRTIEEKIKAFADRYPGLLMERKSLGVALHYRQRPAMESEAIAIIRDLAAQYPGILSTMNGNMVAEIRLGSIHKGDAIRVLLDYPTFKNKVPIFAGDDVTDENGFAMVNALDGISIKIGKGPTSARYRAESIEIFHDWLHALAEQAVSNVSHFLPAYSPSILAERA